MLVVFTSCLCTLSSRFLHTCLRTLSSHLSSHTQFSPPLCCCRCSCSCCCRYCRTFEGSWNTDPEIAITAGGPLRSKKSKRVNPRWTQNPQYVLDVVDVVDVGCILLYSVVLATFSTDVTIQRQNHFGHRSSSNVSEFFFYF